MGQILPEILLRIPGSAWPAVRGLPVGTGRCDSLSLDRELVAASLPGQVRGKTGFSVGTARVTVPQPRDRQFVPWSGSSDRLVDAGAEAVLVAWDERAGTESPLGKWLVSKPAGSLTSSQIAVELDESQARGRDLPNRLPTIAGPVDPVFMIDALARRMGYYSTPAPVASCILSAPFCGGHWAEAGRGTYEPTPGNTWTANTGVPGMTGVAKFGDRIPLGTSYVTANISGEVVLRVLDADVKITTGTIAIRPVGGSWSSTTYAPGLDAAWPTRVTLELVSTETTLTVRAKSSHAAAWSTSVNAATPRKGYFEVTSTAGSISGLQVTTVDDPALWAAPFATMSLFGGSVLAPWVPSDMNVWAGIQHVTDSWGGIAWLTNDDQMRVLNRHEAAGSNRPKTVIDVDRMAEDVDWEVASDDFADRLEVTWWPLTWPDEFTDPTEFQIERMHVPAGESVSVNVDLGGYARTLLPFLHVLDPEIQIATNSEWDANTQADGLGTPVVAGITVTVEHPTPSRGRVTVKNSTAADAWMVADGTTEPGLILRATGVATQEDAGTITRGLSEDEAKFPLTIDLGKTVQSAADAAALTSYLWERVNRPRWRANSVRLPLDWTRDLADILLLDHPRSGLSVNALATGIHIDPSSPGMTVDLIALPPTWSDFDQAWSGKTWANFDALWAGRNWVAFDNDPLKTEA